jgi:hypothetical protein
MEKVPELLETYPRQRPTLPAAWEKIYTDTYKSSREGKTLLYRLTQQLESWMHRKVCATSSAKSTVLELGAGTLNHVQYEHPDTSYDVVEPFHELYVSQPAVSRICHFYDDIVQVPPSNRYGRIISVAVLEHIANLPQAVARSGLLLSPNGKFCAGIPSEGGFLWGFSWRATVGIVARAKLGLDYGDLMRHEHLSTAPEIIGVVRYFFRQCRVSYFPLPFHHFSLYAYIEATDPILERCTRFGNGI